MQSGEKSGRLAQQSQPRDVHFWGWATGTAGMLERWSQILVQVHGFSSESHGFSFFWVPSGDSSSAVSEYS